MLSLARRARLITVLQATLLVGACATTAVPRSDAERSADVVIANQVHDALARDPQIYARHIDVGAERGVVTLSGLVWEINDYMVARRVAQTVPGVVQVVNDLELVRGGARGSR